MKKSILEPASRRASLPLRPSDERELAALRKSARLRAAVEQLTGRELNPDSSEASILEAVFAAGLIALRQVDEAAGYAELAAQRRASLDQRRAVARRRRPSWADEA